MTTPKKHLSRAQPTRPHPMLNLKVPKTWLATLSPSTPTCLTQQIPASLKPIPDDMGEVAKNDVEARDCERVQQRRIRGATRIMTIPVLCPGFPKRGSQLVMSRLGSVRLGSAHVGLAKLGEPSRAKPWLAV
jgi:hypothetical protein